MGAKSNKVLPLGAVLLGSSWNEISRAAVLICMVSAREVFQRKENFLFLVLLLFCLLF